MRLHLHGFHHEICFTFSSNNRCYLGYGFVDCFHPFLSQFGTKILGSQESYVISLLANEQSIDRRGLFGIISKLLYQIAEKIKRVMGGFSATT